MDGVCGGRWDRGRDRGTVVQFPRGSVGRKLSDRDLGPTDGVWGFVLSDPRGQGCGGFTVQLDRGEEIVGSGSTLVLRSEGPLSPSAPLLQGRKRGLGDTERESRVRPLW